MTKEFYALYNMMANSQNPAYMHVFGMATQEMFKWFVANKPDLAQEWLEKLESIRWHQYLSQKEAEKIVDGMVPKAPWKRDVWKQAMTQLELPMEEEPYYNSCALWTEMNKQYSDHAETIARDILKKPLAEIPAEQIVPGIRAMALDLLKDKDHVYNIREYFHL